MSDVTGGCKCARARYRGTRSDMAMFRCYCRDCQQLTGAGHSEMVPLVAESFECSGETREYQMTGGSGRPTWSRFCPHCGSPLTRRSARSGARIYVHAGSLDDPSTFDPTRSIYTEAAQPWDVPHPAPDTE